MLIIFTHFEAHHGFAKSIAFDTKDSEKNMTRFDLQSNPNFTFFNDTNDLPISWVDPLGSCKMHYTCTAKFTDGWNDYVSFSLSTTNTTNGTWSWIYGKEVNVIAKQRMQFVTHMKLNSWATQSHIVMEGFNATTGKWYQIIQCPSGTIGPLEWKEFSCVLSIPSDTTKIRSVLNAGWSSLLGKEATTWFDSINILTTSSPTFNKSSSN